MTIKELYEEAKIQGKEDYKVIICTNRCGWGWHEADSVDFNDDEKEITIYSK